MARAALSTSGVKVVAINDPFIDLEYMVSLDLAVILKKIFLTFVSQ